jgi:hypothetical protein
VGATVEFVWDDCAAVVGPQIARYAALCSSGSNVQIHVIPGMSSLRSMLIKIDLNHPVIYLSSKQECRGTALRLSEVSLLYD